MEGFDKANQQEISKAIEQFKLNTIIKFLHDRFKDDRPREISKLFAQTFPEYSMVSTFTHGGPYASMLLKAYENNGTTQNQIDRIVKISFTAVSIMKENVLATYKVERNMPDTISL